MRTRRIHLVRQRSRLLRSGTVVAAVALAMVSGWAVPAHAAVTCLYDDASDELEVSLGDGDQATLQREGATIKILTVGGDATCSGGTPTVNNTDSIDINGTAGVNSVALSMYGGAFAPGDFNEPGSSDEIEIDVNFDSNDNLHITGAPSGRGANFRAGQAGINVNASERTGRDADVFMTSSTLYIQLAGTQFDPNVISGAGGAGTGPAFPDPLDLRGWEAGDRLTGGVANDYIDGLSGRDVIAGGPGSDDIKGGPGRDTLSFAGPDGVIADLSTGVVSDDGTGASDLVEGIENLVGSARADDLAGTDLKNKISGRGGRDVLLGYGHDDRLLGGGARDELHGDIGADFLHGGRGRIDMCIGGPGRDELRSCEQGSS